MNEYPEGYEVEGQLNIFDWLWELGGYMNPPGEICSEKMTSVGTADNFGTAKEGPKE